MKVRNPCQNEKIDRFITDPELHDAFMYVVFKLTDILHEHNPDLMYPECPFMGFCHDGECFIGRYMRQFPSRDWEQPR